MPVFALGCDAGHRQPERARALRRGGLGTVDVVVYGVQQEASLSTMSCSRPGTRGLSRGSSHEDHASWQSYLTLQKKSFLSPLSKGLRQIGNLGRKGTRDPLPCLSCFYVALKQHADAVASLEVPCPAGPFGAARCGGRTCDKTPSRPVGFSLDS